MTIMDNPDTYEYEPIIGGILRLILSLFLLFLSSTIYATGLIALNPLFTILGIFTVTGSLIMCVRNFNG